MLTFPLTHNHLACLAISLFCISQLLWREMRDLPQERCNNLTMVLRDDELLSRVSLNTIYRRKDEDKDF